MRWMTLPSVSRAVTRMSIQPSSVTSSYRRMSEFVVDRDLSLRPREPGANEKHPQPRFARRLRARIDKLQCGTGIPNSMTAAVSICAQLNVCRFQTGRASQCIDRGHSRINGKPAREVEGGACRRRHKHAVDDTDFVAFDRVRPRLDSWCVPTVGIDDRCGSTGIDLTGSMKRRRRESGEDAAPLGSQPAGLCPQDG